MSDVEIAHFSRTGFLRLTPHLALTFPGWEDAQEKLTALQACLCPREAFPSPCQQWKASVQSMESTHAQEKKARVRGRGMHP